MDDAQENALGPPAAALGAAPPRALLLLLALLGACALVPPLPGGGGAPSPAPVPDVIKEHPWMADVRWPGAAPRPSPRDELLIAQDIEYLLTGDFDVYPLAARRLIHRGQDCLPYLGHAAERHPAPSARKERLAIVFWPVLRDTTEARVLLALSSPYGAVRAAAAATVGERNLPALGPRLIELLEDKDIKVRQAAITSLRMLSGEFHEYRADDPAAARAENAARWHDYWTNR